MELLEHAARGVRERVSRRMTATVDGSSGGEVLAREIVRVARAVGLSTAAVVRGFDGFTPRTDPSACRPPLIVVVTGDPESIDDLVVGVAPVVGRCELTVEDVREIVPALAGSAAETEA
jgi:PII-like signaling protein